MALFMLGKVVARVTHDEITHDEISFESMILSHEVGQEDTKQVVRRMYLIKRTNFFIKTALS